MSREVRVDPIPVAARPKDRAPTWAALENAGTVLVHPDTVVVDAETDAPIAAHYMLPRAALPLAEALAGALPSIRWEADTESLSHEYRLSGIRNPSRVFGHSPPVPLRRRYWCGVSHFDTEHPDVAAGLRHMTPFVWDLFAGRLPAEAAAHHAAVDGLVHRDWWLGPEGRPVPFTSGILNKTSVLPYHTDAGNVAGSWSSMLVMRRRVGGGYLHVPGYGVAFSCPNGSVLSFAGGTHLHAVTPLARRSGGPSYRFSVVWYARSEMRVCGSADDEARRAQTVATERGDEMAARIRAGETL
jgi:hypothetical protein